MKKTKLFLGALAALLLVLLYAAKLYHELTPPTTPASKSAPLPKGKRSISFGLTFTREVKDEQ